MSGYVIVIRNGQPPETSLYNLEDGQKLLAVVALLENESPPDGPPPAEKVTFLIGVNVRSGSGTTYGVVGSLAAGDEAEVLERRRPPGWLHDWGRLGRVWRGGRLRSDLPDGEKWAYLARTRNA
jgi:hypothetical protein